MEARACTSQIAQVWRILVPCNMNLHRRAAQKVTVKSVSAVRLGSCITWQRECTAQAANCKPLVFGACLMSGQVMKQHPFLPARTASNQLYQNRCQACVNKHNEGCNMPLAALGPSRAMHPTINMHPTVRVSRTEQLRALHERCRPALQHMRSRQPRQHLSCHRLHTTKCHRSI